MKIQITKIIILGHLFILLASCQKLIEIDPPINSVEQSIVFKTDEQAISAIVGLYTRINASGFASGGVASISYLTGFSSDELIGYSSATTIFYQNQLTADNTNNSALYTNIFLSVYQSNLILEGLSSPNGVSPTLKAQLQGEAYFMRAFTNFYLVNLYGPIPLQLTSDYRVTSLAPRSSVDIVYAQIIADLKAAEALLAVNYPSAGKVRPNKSVAQAMLARVYLYQKDWDNAEKYASYLINNTAAYSLVGYNDVFLSNSLEAIWQIAPTPNTNALDAATFIPASLTSIPTVYSLRADFALNAFETGDKRLSNWIKSYTVGSTTYFYPYKYKVRSATVATEYSTILRLAEQYLIRAEARINKGDTQNGIIDLNLVRLRTVAGVNANSIPPLSVTLSRSDALLALEKERRLELFAEWGHRWFDLKRTNRADLVLGSTKTTWKPFYKLYPIPKAEIDRNINITQNEGY